MPPYAPLWRGWTLTYKTHSQPRPPVDPSTRHRAVPGFSYPKIEANGLVWTGEDGRHRIVRTFLSQQTPARSVYVLWRDDMPLVNLNVQYTSPKQHSTAMEFLARMAKI